MLAAIGAGAIAGAIALPQLRQRLTTAHLVLAATLATSAASAGLVAVDSVAHAASLLAAAGASWIVVLTLLNTAAQSVLPNWVRGRGLAVYLTVFFGSMTLGSVIWGQLAQITSIQIALLTAAAAGAVLAVAALPLPLPQGDVDLTPSHHWPAPAISTDVETDHGPVMIQVEYEIAPEQRQAFVREAQKLREIRLRDGAYQWGLMLHSTDARRVIEWFLVGSWAEHLRQHDRVSIADKAVQDKVWAFHQGAAPPLTTHLVTLRVE
jgi:MFS family permease